MGERRDGQQAGWKNKSELLFEGYLRTHGYSDFKFEPAVPGTSRTPDYRLEHGGTPILFEVKEFRGVPGDFTRGFGSFDPYAPLREKIDQARHKFRDCKEFCCCLVLYNRDKPLVLLDWKYVYGAMLGDLGFEVPLALGGRAAPEEDVRAVFTTGGRMHQERHGTARTPQNQTISAIIVLGRVPVGDRLFAEHCRNREQQLGRNLTLEERCHELDRVACTEMHPSHRPLRLVVHENPYARIPLPEDLFRGPYDERYGARDGRVQRLFQGERLAVVPED